MRNRDTYNWVFMDLDLLIGKRKKNVVGMFLVLIFFGTTGLAQADEVISPLQSQHASGNPIITSPDAVTVIAGPLEAERTSLLKTIQQAKGKGIGIRPYVTAFLNVESMVDKGASAESIRTKVDSLKASLDTQMAPLANRPSTALSSSVGIVGLKFKSVDHQPVEIEEVFPDTPAEKAQLKAGDIITHVDGRSTKGLTKDEIFHAIIGPPNTKLILTVQRGDETFSKTLTRLHALDFAKAHPSIWDMYSN